MALYVPHSYTGLAPHPLPPCHDTLPWLKRQEDRDQFVARAAEKEHEHRTKMAGLTQKKGFLAGVMQVATDVGHRVTQVAEAGVHKGKHMMHQEFDDLAQKRFRDHFNASSEPGEQLLGDFRCRVVNNAGPGIPTFYDGWLEISNMRILFICANRLNFYFPLTDLVSIQKAIVNKTTDGGLFISALPHQAVIPQCIQLYTRQASVHQFFAFHSIRQSKEGCIRDAYCVAEYAWRSRVQVPNPAYRYLAPGQSAAPTHGPGAAFAAESDGRDAVPAPGEGGPAGPAAAGAHPPPMGAPGSAPPPIGVPVGTAYGGAPPPVGQMEGGYFSGYEGGPSPHGAPQMGTPVRDGAYPQTQLAKAPAPLPP